jgi:RecA-family ATPase
VTYVADGLHTSEETTEAALDERLEQTITANKIDVLVIDPWAVFFGGKENSNDEAEIALAALRRLQLEHGLTIIVLHHFGKGTQVRDPEDLWRGASRLADWASTRVTLSEYYTLEQARKQGMTRHQARRYALVRMLRRSAASPPDMAIKLNVETGQWDRWQTSGLAAERELTPAEVAAKCPDDGWDSATAAAAALGVNRNKAAILLEQAKAERLLEDFTGPRRARGWRRPPKKELF